MGVAGVTGIGLVDADCPVGLVVTGDAGCGDKNVGYVVVDRGLVVQVVEVVLRVASGAVAGATGGVTVGAGNQDAGGRSVAGGAGVGLVDADSAVGFVVAANAFVRCCDDGGVVAGL